MPVVQRILFAVLAVGVGVGLGALLHAIGVESWGVLVVVLAAAALVGYSNWRRSR